MAQPALTSTGEALPRPEGLQGIIADWSSDQRAFKNVPWGKAMMWIFLLSDTFIFSSFLISYMTVRISTTVPWPNPSEVFGLTVGGTEVPLLLIAIMTFILISSSGTMVLAVNFGYRKDRVKTFVFLLLTALHGLHVLGGLWVWGRTTAKVWRGVEVGKVRLSVELCTVYWHYLFLVWLVLFALLLSN